VPVAKLLVPARMIDPDNAEVSTSAGQKCSRKVSLPTRCTSRKVIQYDTEASEYHGALVSVTDLCEDMAPEGDSEEYAKLQLMADAD
jgi:hypothetical protein